MTTDIVIKIMLMLAGLTGLGLVLDSERIMWIGAGSYFCFIGGLGICGLLGIV